MSGQRKPRPVVNDSQLEYLASRNGSLFYEAWMMKEAETRCVPPKDAAYNMAVESFLLHFRLIRDFLYPNDLIWSEGDNVVAADYNPTWTKTDGDWNECSPQERKRVNKLLAHLSYSRRALDHSWPTALMRQEVIQSLASFVRSLPPERQLWFKDWFEADTIDWLRREPK